MEITKERAIAKIIFWQQLTLILFILFLFLIVGVILYDIKENLILYYFEETIAHISCYVFFGLVGTVSTFLLFKSLSLLKAYQRNKEHLDLELAFKNQRHFWMIGPMILIFLVSIFIIVLILLTINLFL